jgi:hypothetical protein
MGKCFFLVTATSFLRPEAAAFCDLKSQQADLERREAEFAPSPASHGKT